MKNLLPTDVIFHSKSRDLSILTLGARTVFEMSKATDLWSEVMHNVI